MSSISKLSNHFNTMDYIRDYVLSKINYFLTRTEFASPITNLNELPEGLWVYWVQNYIIKSIDSTIQGPLTVKQVNKLIQNLEKRFNTTLSELSPKKIFSGDLSGLDNFTECLLSLDDDKGLNNPNISFGSDMMQNSELDTPRKYLGYNQLPQNHPDRCKIAIQALLETLKGLNIPIPDPVPSTLIEFPDDIFDTIIQRAFPLPPFPTLRDPKHQYQHLLNILQTTILNHQLYHITAHHLYHHNSTAWLYMTEILVAIIRMVLLHPFERIRDFSLQSSPERQLTPPPTLPDNKQLTPNQNGNRASRNEFKTPLSKLTRPGTIKRK